MSACFSYDVINWIGLAHQIYYPAQSSVGLALWPCLGHIMTVMVFQEIANYNSYVAGQQSVLNIWDIF